MFNIKKIDGIKCLCLKDDILLKHGQKIDGIIKDKLVTGKLYIQDIYNLYFCQNFFEGSTPDDNNTLGYSKSWTFRLENSLTFSEDVKLNKIFKNLNGNIYKNIIDITSDSVVKQDIRIIDEKISIINRVTLCKYQDHPDCCGVKLLYGFDEADIIIYNRYKNINIDNFIKVLKEKSLAPKLAHIAQYQKNTINFLEECGFKSIYEYENPNSQNIITLYQLEH